MSKSSKESVDTLFNVGKNILRFFNLLDRSNHLSITNVAVIVCVTKMAIAPQVSIVDAGALLISLLNYGHKRMEANKASKEEAQSAVQAEFQEIKSAMTKVVDVQNKITQDVSQMKATSELVEKQAQETKKLLSNSNLAQAFKPRT